MPPILTVLTAAVLPTGNPSVETIAVLLLAVAFAALTPLLLRFFYIHLITYDL